MTTMLMILAAVVAAFGIIGGILYGSMLNTSRPADRTGANAPDGGEAPVHGFSIPEASDGGGGD